MYKWVEAEEGVEMREDSTTAPCEASENRLYEEKELFHLSGFY